MVQIRKKDLETICSIFSRFSEIKEVRVFGSRANGQAKRASDIDLAVTAPALSARAWLELKDTLENAPVVFEFDILHLDPLENEPLQKKILKEGQVIYSAL